MKKNILSKNEWTIKRDKLKQTSKLNEKNQNQKRKIIVKYTKTVKKQNKHKSNEKQIRQNLASERNTKQNTTLNLKYNDNDDDY